MRFMHLGNGGLGKDMACVHVCTEYCGDGDEENGWAERDGGDKLYYLI